MATGKWRGNKTMKKHKCVVELINGEIVEGGFCEINVRKREYTIYRGNPNSTQRIWKNTICIIPQTSVLKIVQEEI